MNEPLIKDKVERLYIRKDDIRSAVSGLKKELTEHWSNTPYYEIGLHDMELIVDKWFPAFKDSNSQTSEVIGKSSPVVCTGSGGSEIDEKIPLSAKAQKECVLMCIVDSELACVTYGPDLVRLITVAHNMGKSLSQPSIEMSKTGFAHYDGITAQGGDTGELSGRDTDREAVSLTDVKHAPIKGCCSDCSWMKNNTQECDCECHKEVGK